MAIGRQLWAIQFKGDYPQLLVDSEETAKKAGTALAQKQGRAVTYAPLTYLSSKSLESIAERGFHTVFLYYSKSKMQATTTHLTADIDATIRAVTKPRVRVHSSINGLHVTVQSLVLDDKDTAQQVALKYWAAHPQHEELMARLLEWRTWAPDSAFDEYVKTKNAEAGEAAKADPYVHRNIQNMTLKERVQQPNPAVSII